MNALIVSGGTPPTNSLLLKYKEKADIILGADKGCDVLYANDIVPDYILGDFDSANLDIITKLENLGAIKIKYNKEKDFTDTESAIDLAIEKGASKIILLGATGTRYDHVFGNVGLILKGLNLGVEIEIVDTHNRIFMINKNSILDGNKGQIVSFQAYSRDVEELSIVGAKYELEKYDLKIGNPLTISNEFMDDKIEVNFKSGILIVFYTKD